MDLTDLKGSVEMINRAEEMLACYFWVRMEGIVALWYLKSDHEYVNRIIETMTAWSFNERCYEEIMKVIDEERNMDNECRMIAEFFVYMIDNEENGPTPVDVLSPYLTESERSELIQIYESMKREIKEVLKLDYFENKAKVKAEQRRFMGESRFKEAEKDVSMLGLLGVLIKRNFRIPEE